MIHHERQIGICGTFDVENYGDLLFPLIAEAELLRRLGPMKLHRFSYREKTASNWPYSVDSLASLPAATGNLDGMVIGGGDLIRFDKGVAPGYYPPTSDIHHPTGYWLTPMLIALQHGLPVVWNAPGVYGEIPTWAEPLLELVINLSSYVSVRDEASRQALSHFAENKEIKVVPDTVFGVAQLINLEQPSAEYLRLRETIGLKGPYIIVQAITGLEAFLRLAQNHPQVFQDYQLVVLPIGPILGDNAAIFDDNLPGSIRLTTWPNPLLLTELIGQAAAVVGVSLHLTITALAFGIPIFRPAKTLNLPKYAILLDFDAVATFDNTSEIDPEWFTMKLTRAGASPAIQTATSRLSRHWDDIASIFARQDRETTALETLGRFWQSMPGLLETWSTRYTRALDEYDAMIAKQNVINAQHDTAIAQRDAAINAIYNSNSWKITTPLRTLTRILRRQKY